MAIITREFGPGAFTPRSSSFPAFVKADGSNYPVEGLAFDAGADEAAFVTFMATAYGSGNLTVRFLWYADTASSGNVVWGAAIAAITPDADTQDIETDGLATEATVTDSHLGTTGQRLHTASATVSSLDSIAANDYVTLRIRRLGSNVSDTMANDAILVKVIVEYSDT